jgi:hypothetical protein
MATLARAFALFTAAIVQARTDGDAFARHLTRFDSLSPLPRISCMHARTIGVPTVSRQLAFACSIVSAWARCGAPSSASASDPARQAVTRPRDNLGEAVADARAFMRAPSR